MLGNIAGAAEFVARNARKNHFLAIRRHGVTVPAPVLSGHALAGPGRRPVRTRIECRLYERTGPAWRGISFGQASLVPLRGELLKLLRCLQSLREVRPGNPSRVQARPAPPLHSRTRSSLQRAGRHCRPHFASHRESSSEGSSVMKPSTSPAGLGKCPAGGVRLVSDGCAGRSASAK